MENITNKLININDHFKIKCLQDANVALHINNSLHKIFLYIQPR